MDKEEYYKEQLSSLKDMFARTTSHMQKLQEDLKTAKEQVEESNNKLNQSISYAQKLQNYLLPFNYNSCVFSELYFHVKQRDHIGGDFIYITEIDNKVYFAVMDCTGHGIPGALLTMMGYSFLNEIIIKNNSLNANEILERLDEKFNHFFHPKNRQQTMQDGMDGVLCIFNSKTSVLQYAMAGRPFWAKINGKWIKNRPDRNSIGGLTLSDFELHEVLLNKGDEVFLFSDGLTDQFGGERNKKFLTKRLYQHLVQDNFINLKSKLDSLLQSLTEWQGDEEQTDDIAYIAIKR